ncbi:hypothetical protein B0A48_08556 [Cryoendolithus antarcticus]|uniref:Uncharacterized protein n=1 Tax=Cryoendolithus antarcticus TaxID=1507870 RepID=A0A1V8T6A9_9PEZI|nr:hypothetical protein B0A48_08556 [Cryoendolithus antarcticus]
MPRLRKKMTGAELTAELTKRDFAARRERGEAALPLKAMNMEYFDNLHKEYDSQRDSRVASASRERGGSSSSSRIPLPVDPQARRKARIAEEMKAKNVENSKKANEKRQQELLDDDWKERYAKAKAVAAEATARLEKAEADLREEYEQKMRGRPMFVLERDEEGVMEPMPKGSFGGMGVEMLPQRTSGDDDVEPVGMLPSAALTDDFEEGEIREHELPPRPESPLLPPTPKMASRATMPRLTRATSTNDVNESKTIAQIAAEKQAKKPVREEEKVHKATDNPNILHYADVYEQTLYGMFDVAQTPLMPPYPIATRDTNQLNAACLDHASNSIRNQDLASTENYPSVIGPDTDISMIKDPTFFHQAQDMKRERQFQVVKKYRKISRQLEADQLDGKIDPDQDVLAGTITPGPTGSVIYFTKYGQYYGEQLRSEYEAEKQVKDIAKQEQFEDWLADQRIDINSLTEDTPTLTTLRRSLSEATARIAALQNTATEHARLQSLYEDTLTEATERIRNYVYAQNEHLLAVHKHYTELLAQARDETLTAQRVHSDWQAGLGRLNEEMRKVVKSREEEGAGPWRKKVGALREENAVLRRLAGWPAAELEDEAEGDDEAEKEQEPVMEQVHMTGGDLLKERVLQERMGQPTGGR